MKERLSRIVLTGGPSCGKTTLINYLQDQGYQTIPEVPRQIIEQRKNYSLTKQEWETRQILMYDKQLQEESKYNQGTVFQDRSTIDIFAYSKKYIGKIPFTPQPTPTYHKVFILERLPFVNDGLRVESGNQEAEEIHQALLQEYQLQGINPIILPAFKQKTLEESVAKRLDFIFSQTSV